MGGRSLGVSLVYRLISFICIYGEFLSPVFRINPTSNHKAQEFRQHCSGDGMKIHRMFPYSVGHWPSRPMCVDQPLPGMDQWRSW